jgi:hypothetical protein
MLQILAELIITVSFSRSGALRVAKPSRFSLHGHGYGNGNKHGQETDTDKDMEKDKDMVMDMDMDIDMEMGTWTSFCSTNKLVLQSL